MGLKAPGFGARLCTPPGSAAHHRCSGAGGLSELGLFVCKRIALGTSLVAQWLGLRAPSAGGPGSIPGQGTRSHICAATKSLHATTKETTCCN